MKHPHSTWRKISKWGAPILTVATSAVVLTGAAWIHRIETSQTQSRQTATSSTNAVSNTTEPGGNTSTTEPSGQLSAGQAGSQTTGNTLTTSQSTSPSSQAKKGSDKESGKSKDTSSGQESGQTGTSGETSHKQTASSGHKTSSQSTTSVSTTTNAPTQDVGFSPVSGGKVEALSGSVPPEGTTVSSVITQYGSNPVTTWSDSSVRGPGGVRLTVPSGTNPKDMLVLALSHGVLWAVIPPTTFVDGSRGAALRPTVLYYTAFPRKAGVTASLTQGSTPIGVIPVSVPRNTQDEWAGWFGAKPPTQTASSQTDTQTAVGQSNTTANRTGGSTAGSAQTVTSTSSTGQPGSGDSTPVNKTDQTTSNQSNTTNQDKTANQSTQSTTSTGRNQSQAPTGTSLYLQALYKTSNGAVIVLSVDTGDPATNKLWTYLWNETDGTLTPITVLQNGDGTFSWFVVGTHLVYWETRHMLPPTDIYFSGAQYMMNVDSRKVFPIHLGTWASVAVTNGDNLDFRVKNTFTWKTFIPDLSIMSPGSKD